MERLTTDTPQDNLEVALNLFYIKNRETWVRGGGPGPEYEDISLFDFTRLVVKEHIPDVELPADNDNLAMMMPEWLCDGSDTAEGIIALLYTAAWAYAELRHRLAAYEDTGYTPEDFDRLCREMSDLRTALALPTYESLRDVIRKGRLVLLAVPPSMRPGCTSSFVYIIEDGEIFEDSVYEVILGEDANRQLGVMYSTHEGICFRQECFGKTVFLTREEAEAALVPDICVGNTEGGEIDAG